MFSVTYLSIYLLFLFVVNHHPYRSVNGENLRETIQQHFGVDCGYGQYVDVCCVFFCKNEVN